MIKYKISGLFLTLMFVGGLVFLSCSTAEEPEKPNIVLIYVDDLGYGDPGCYGGTDIKTPNMDRLAAEGVRFTDAHVTCAVCGPSRVGILSGMYQQRLGVYWNNDVWKEHGWVFPKDVKVIPQVMKDAGYVTGHIGKWNISEFAQPFVDEAHDVMLWKGAYYPDENGHYQGVNEGDFNPEPHGWGPPFEGAEYLTDRLTRHATGFIEKHKAEPFFLYLAYNAPHTPAQADRKYDEIYSHLEPEPYRIYAGMVSSLDENIGKVLDKIEETGLNENTLVIFASDNGPARGGRYIKGWLEDWPTTSMGSAGPLNGRKGNRYEGGHREPFIIKWPSKLEGGKVYEGLSSTLDILPTIAVAGGADLPQQYVDGVDLMPFLLKKTSAAPHDTLYWMTHSQAAVRAGDWKLIMMEKGRAELYNLADDLGEKKNLSQENPQKVGELVSAIIAWSEGHPNPTAYENKPDLTIYLKPE